MSSQPQRGGNRNLDSYVGVHTRVELFRADHPKGRILTQIVKEEPVTVRAEVYFEDNETSIPNGVGHADEAGGMGNRGRSALEMTETAAVGRALAFCGYEVKEGIASREEVQGASLRAVPPADGEKAEEERRARAKGLVSRGLVTRQDNGYAVGDGAIRDPHTYLVTRDAGNHIRCTCTEFAAAPAAKCVHILAVKEYVAASQQQATEEEQQSAAKLRERIYREFAKLEYSADDIAEYMRKNEELHGGTVLEVMSLEQLAVVASGLEIE